MFFAYQLLDKILGPYIRQS